jgi:hypothetical protein
MNFWFDEIGFCGFLKIAGPVNPGISSKNVLFVPIFKISGAWRGGMVYSKGSNTQKPANAG